ncbi:MAG: sulfatase-like hydrolase/transferase, partial [Anaerolineales bacterium]|nr:sulfatase-like hydrolase/transferase [Anaerolineales bacterium]
SQIDGSEMAANLRLPDDKIVPDIYYIILDGYARDDILHKFYQLDNSDFLDDLNQLGFYIAYCSQSNYAQTQLSLASSLNSNYLENLNERYNSGNTSRLGLPELIKHSSVRQALQNLGYKTIAFDSGYDATRFEDADQYYSPRIVQDINDFEDLFIRTTFARVLAEGISFLNLPPDWEARDQAHRERILYTLEKLKEIPDEAGPKFVFAHIISPHWPHVFGPNGEPVHEHPDSVSGYTNQVIFISDQIQSVLTEIIENSEIPPIIILQGDHGSVIESPQRRMSILNAYFLPDNGDQLLYEEISPVNTFRLIFNYYFGDEAPLLEDISKFSSYEDPYNYQNIQNQRPGCP